MEDQLDSSLMDEYDPRISTKGKGLGIAGMIIGILALIWSVVPMVGAGALWFSVIGSVLSIIAFFVAKSNKNPKRGMMVAGIATNIAALALSAYWIYKITSTVMDIESSMRDMDTTAMRQALNEAFNEANNDSTAH
jgi:ABC-type uncharacterized transport system permease subunit